MQIRDLWPQCVPNSFILPALFWITQIFYFILFSYKDQTLCQLVLWYDFSHAKTRFEGLKLLNFSLFATSVWQHFVKKKPVNFKIAPKLLKMPQIKIKWIILWSKNTPDFLPNILLQYSHTKVGQFYCIFCIINKVKTRIFVFSHFLGHIWFFKL